MKPTTLKPFASAMALLLCVPLTAARAQTEISPAEGRAIAKEAYIYGEPMVDGYRIQYDYLVDRPNPEYKGPWNQVHKWRALSRLTTRQSRRPTRTRPTRLLAWT